jgi:hypothetical protein
MSFIVGAGNRHRGDWLLREEPLYSAHPGWFHERRAQLSCTFAVHHKDSC